MAFKKGHKINAGRKCSEETRKKIGVYWKGRKQSPEHNEKRRLANINRKYRKCSEETKRKISKSMKGKNTWSKGKLLSQEHKERLSKIIKGKKLPPFTKEHRRKLSETKKGKKNHNWKGGISEINNRIRNSLEYKLWREAVFKRDNWICVWCRKIGGKLNADHIKPFALFPVLRFAIDNGRTLCIDCHKKTDSYGYNWKKINNNVSIYIT